VLFFVFLLFVLLLSLVFFLFLLIFLFFLPLLLLVTFLALFIFVLLLFLLFFVFLLGLRNFRYWLIDNTLLFNFFWERGALIDFQWICFNFTWIERLFFFLFPFGIMLFLFDFRFLFFLLFFVFFLFVVLLLFFLFFLLFFFVIFLIMFVLLLFTVIRNFALVNNRRTWQLNFFLFLLDVRESLVTVLIELLMIPLNFPYCLTNFLINLNNNSCCYWKSTNLFLKSLSFNSLRYNTKFVD